MNISYPDPKRKMRKLVFYVIGAWCCFSMSAHSDDGLALVQKPAKPEDLLQKLIIHAYTYNITAIPGKMPDGYSIHFEHWREGKLKDVVKTQVFHFGSEKKEKTSFFISFPVPPRMDVLVSTDNDQGEFRKVLPFPVKLDDRGATSADYRRSISSSELKGKSSLVLGFMLANVIAPPLPNTFKGEKLYNDLEAKIDGYQKLIVEEKLDNVDFLIYRLVFENRKEGKFDASNGKRVPAKKRR